MRTFFVSVPSDFSFDQVVGAENMEIGAFIKDNKYHVTGSNPLAQCFNLGLKFDPSLVASDCEEIYLLDHWLEVIVPQLVEEGFTAKRASRALLELLRFTDGITFRGIGKVKLTDLLMTHLDDLPAGGSIWQLDDAFLFICESGWDYVEPTPFGTWMSSADPSQSHTPSVTPLTDLEQIPAEEWARIAGNQTRKLFHAEGGNWALAKALMAQQS